MRLRLLFASLFLATVVYGETFPLPFRAADRELLGAETTVILLACATEERCVLNAPGATEALPPCSTFKIWNTLIGLETGLLARPDEPFYTWDGQTRSRAEWNRDLPLQEAFRVSCVPAFQTLARRIGPTTMAAWLAKIDYGNQDISAGIDAFWLPAEGRRPLLITAEAQAALLRRLVLGQLPVSAPTRATLKTIMQVKTTPRGTLYGKTGTGYLTPTLNVGWFIGYIECGPQTYVFAAVNQSAQTTGPLLRTALEEVFTAHGYL